MKRPPVVAGLLFIALGVVLLLDRTGVIADAGELIGDWWPAAVVLAGLGQALLPPRNTSGGLVIAVIGGALLLWTLDVVDTLALLLPLLLIAFGIWLIAGRVRTGPDGAAHLDEHVSVTTVFGDRRLEGAHGPFLGGDITTVFGDVDLDLRHAEVDGEATMQTTTVFGDVDLIVPSHWRVKVNGPQIFGDVDVAEPVGAEPDGPLLVLRTVTVFGDVEVRRSPATTAGTH